MIFTPFQPNRQPNSRRLCPKTSFVEKPFLDHLAAPQLAGQGINLCHIVAARGCFALTTAQRSGLMQDLLNGSGASGCSGCLRQRISGCVAAGRACALHFRRRRSSPSHLRDPTLARRGAFGACRPRRDGVYDAYYAQTDVMMRLGSQPNPMRSPIMTSKSLSKITRIPADAVIPHAKLSEYPLSSSKERQVAVLGPGGIHPGQPRSVSESDPATDCRT